MTYDIVIRGGTHRRRNGRVPFAVDVGGRRRQDRRGRQGRPRRAGARSTPTASPSRRASSTSTPISTPRSAGIPTCTPVSWHGVTTALIGNCGVTFAPCKPTDRELAGRHDGDGRGHSAPGDPDRPAVDVGETTATISTRIETLRPGINIAGLVGHSAVRFYVMGERAFDEQATDGRARQMAAIVGGAIDDGAVGFSTNRFAPHKAPDGRSIPGTFADPAELVEIGKVVAARGGLMQAVGATAGRAAGHRRPSRRRLLFSYGVGRDKGAGRSQAEGLEPLCGGPRHDRHHPGEGHRLHVRPAVQPAVPRRGLGRLRGLDLAGRVAAIRDAEIGRS